MTAPSVHRQTVQPLAVTGFSCSDFAFSFFFHFMYIDTHITQNVHHYGHFFATWQNGHTFCKTSRNKPQLPKHKLYLFGQITLTTHSPLCTKTESTIQTLTRRAQLVCDSPDSLQDETDYLNNVFSKNNYNTDFVRRNTHSNTDSNNQTNVNSGPVTTATLPHIRGTSETIAHI